MGLPDMENVPETGAVFTLGRSRFAENVASHFFIRKDPVVKLTCGDEHSAVVCQSGRLFVFGSNDWGQLGLGHKNHISKPSCVKALKPERVTHVACGRTHTLICTEERKVFACGSDQEGQLGRGNSTIGDSSNVPVLIYTCENSDERVVELAAGSHHSMLLTSDGTVFAWGSNLEGQLGLSGVSGLLREPTKVPLPEPVKRITAGYYHSAFLTENGGVYVCGESESGKLGIEVSFSTQVAPKQIKLPLPAVNVSCGGHHTLLLTEDGNLYCTGSNGNGQLGLGMEITEISTPKLLARNDELKDDGIVEIACGESHSAFLTESGKLFTCGDGRHGKLGLEENENNVHEFTYASKYQELFVSRVACGGCHTILVGRKRRTETNNEQLDNALPKKNTLPPLKLPPGRIHNDLETEKNDESQRTDVNNEKSKTEKTSPSTTTNEKNSKDSMEQSNAVENNLNEKEMPVEEDKPVETGNETSNGKIDSQETNENSLSSSELKQTEKTVIHENVVDVEPVKEFLDSTENDVNDRLTQETEEQPSDELKTTNSEATVKDNAMENPETHLKVEEKKLPDNVDVQSPVLPIESTEQETQDKVLDKVPESSKPKEQTEPKNRADTSQKMHLKTKSKTCHIV